MSRGGDAGAPGTGASESGDRGAGASASQGEGLGASRGAGVRATAPGKVMLLGEYAVLEGAPALVLAVDRRAAAEAGPAPGPHHRLTAPDLGLAGWAFRLAGGRLVPAAAPPPGLAERLRLFERVVEVVAQTGAGGLAPPPPTHLLLDTAAFRDPTTGAKLGLGSSAAVAVALAAALRAWWGSGGGARAGAAGGEPPWPGPDAIFPLALRAHRAAQGERGSGVDLAAAVFGGLRRYRPPAPGSVQPAESAPLPLPEGVGFGVVFTGRSADTSALTARVAAAGRAQPAAHRRVMDDLTALVEAGSRALACGDLPGLGAAVRGYHAGLVALGRLAGVALVTEAHARLAARAEAAGLAYKPSGAGGGDVGLCCGAAPEVAAFLAALPAELGTAVHVAPAPLGLELSALP